MEAPSVKASVGLVDRILAAGPSVVAVVIMGVIIAWLGVNALEGLKTQWGKISDAISRSTSIEEERLGVELRRTVALEGLSALALDMHDRHSRLVAAVVSAAENNERAADAMERMALTGRQDRYMWHWLEHQYRGGEYSHSYLEDSDSAEVNPEHMRAIESRGGR